MTGIGNRAFLLSYCEFLILICKRELTGIVFPEEITGMSADELQLNEAMGDLITDKYLLPGDDGKYKISSDIGHVLDIIAQASGIYVVEEMQNSFAACFMYRVNMDVVSLNIDTHHKDWVRLEMCRFEDKIEEFMSFPMARIQIQCFKPGVEEPERVVIITDSDSVEESLDKILEV